MKDDTQKPNETRIEWNARRLREIKEETAKILARAEKDQKKSKPIEWLLKNQKITKPGSRDAAYAKKRAEAKKKKKK